ncbi:MAG: hypothetical protein AAF533_19795 [Acidobacteriota bacterium]
MSTAARYLPASTGLGSDGPPSSRDRWTAWRRQVVGVARMTATLAFRQQGALVLAERALVVQALLGLVLYLVNAFYPFQGMLTIFAAIAVTYAIGSGVVVFTLMARDAVAEVTSKSRDHLATGPLPASAYLMGKSLFFVLLQCFLLCTRFPAFAAAAVVSPFGLGHVLLIFVVMAIWVFGTVVWVVRQASLAEQWPTSNDGDDDDQASFHRRIQSLARQSGQAAAQNASLQSAVIFLGPILAFLLAVFTMVGVNTHEMVRLLMWAAPPLAAYAAFLPDIGIRLLGFALPGWAMTLVLHVVSVPASYYSAEARWKAPDRLRGLGLRWSSALAWSTPGVMTAGLTSFQAAAHGWALLLIPILAGTWAAAQGTLSPVADLGKRHLHGWRRILGLDRSTSWFLGLVVVALNGLLLARFAPSGVTTKPWLLAAALPLLALPLLFATTLGSLAFRESVRRRIGSLLVLGAFLLLAALPVIQSSWRQVPGMEFTRALQPFVDTSSLLSPITSLRAMLAELLTRAPSAFSKGTVGWQWAVPLQFALVGLGWQVDRWLTAKKAEHDD